MATKTMKACDVYGTVRKLRRIGIIIEERLDDDASPVLPFSGGHEDEARNLNPVLLARTLVLSPKAVKRLLHFCERGSTKPTPRKARDEDPASAS